MGRGTHCRVSKSTSPSHRAVDRWFHGSWNRAPLKQAGYCVVFVPLKNGKPSGNYEIFANGFTGKESITGAGQAKYRPCGLAQGPDGALYISDDKEGKIWKIVYGQ